MTTERVALVTGGSAGIGRAICEQLLGEGCTVISMARRKADLAHPRLVSIEVDLMDRAATAEAAADAAQRYAITTLIHNAGVMRPALVADVQLGDLDALVELHFAAAIQLVQAVLPAMRAARFGRIVLLSSRAALGLATRTAYSATKSGMFGMARTWALELAADGITVNVVAPGLVRTKLSARIVENEASRKTSEAMHPLGRVGEPDDVASLLAWLVDPQVAWITGQVFGVDGGLGTVRSR